MKGRKIWKKCVAGMLAAVMMMGMSIGVSAEESGKVASGFNPVQNGSVTIIKKDSTSPNSPISGVTFQYTKIGDFVQDEKDGNVVLGFSLESKLTNKIQIQTPSLGITKDGVPYYDGAAIQKELQAPEHSDKLTELATEVFGTTNSNGTVSKSDMPLGLYLFVETKAPAGVQTAHAPFILAVPMTSVDGMGWEYEITVEPKNDLIPKYPTPTKTVTDTKLDEAKHTASVGDVLTYTLKTDVIDAFGELNKLVLHDAMSKGLTLQKKAGNAYADANLVTVEDDKANIFTVTGRNRVTNAEEDLTTNSISVIAEKTKMGTNLSITFRNPNVIKETYDSVSVSYPAKVNKSAAIYDPNTNQVTLDYGTQTGIEGNEVSVYTYGYALQKVDEAENVLGGAEFQIFASEKDAKLRQNPLSFLSEKANGTLENKAISGKDGIVKFYGLKPGTYWIAETKAPQGYNLLKDPVEITVTSKTGLLADGLADIRIMNTKGFALPTTGGAGTIAFTLGGILVMILAVVIYLKSRKKQS